MKKVLLFNLVFFLLTLKAFCQINERLDSIKIQHLSGLCKVWGLLKYYHPRIQEGKIDWDTTLVVYLPRVLEANNSAEYNNIVNQLILSPGRVSRISKPYKYLPKDTSYNNFDFGWIQNDRLFSDENRKLLFEVIENYKPRNNVYIEREVNKYYLDQGRPNYYFKNEYQPDTVHALLALYRYWNVINYFFAYKKNTDENWNDVLIEFIPKITESAGTVQFYLILAELITKINDCHGFFENYNFDNEFGYYYYPIEVKYIENKTVITKIPQSIAGETRLNIGDIVQQINGTDIHLIRNEFKKYCGCSSPLSVEREINKGILRSPENGIDFMVLDSNNTSQRIFIRNTNDLWKVKRDTLGHKLDSEIGYINLEHMSQKDIRIAFNNLKNEKAIIFDLRNNSHVPLFDIALRLPSVGRNNLVFAKYCRGNLKYPGSFIISNKKNSYFGLKSFYKKYKGKVVFLINENVQSTYEWSLMGLKGAYNITLVGNNTAGADGEANSFLVQKNFLAYFTGDAVFWPDGSQTQRVGIKPDIYVTPTIKGLRAKRDEILDRAIEFIITGK